MRQGIFISKLPYILRQPVCVLSNAKFFDRLPKGSYGWSGAYGTHFWVDPTNGIVAIYMKNSRKDGGSGAVTAAHFEEDVYASL